MLTKQDKHDYKTCELVVRYNSIREYLFLHICSFTLLYLLLAAHN
jgi:hypothetical protein